MSHCCAPTFPTMTLGRPIFSVKHLKVEDSDEAQNDMESTQKDEFNRIWLISMILGGLTFFLLVVIVGQIRKPQTAHKEQQNLEQSQKVGCVYINSAAILLKTLTSKRPASRAEVETHVIYRAKLLTEQPELQHRL
ncbi:uncharacterized protein LOC113157242 isoform X2 [Anabas testudineus]|uniref:uncharacterized protein LOC113157242 isoform X2 n=1 Tax=Anabas testudineus TaxID=64144 RepID=UPI000E46199F|nr:uncharacterized protein LOC113157242 isoform X2 [Anabas testudineus]